MSSKILKQIKKQAENEPSDDIEIVLKWADIVLNNSRSTKVFMSLVNISFIGKYPYKKRYTPTAELRQLLCKKVK